MADPRFVARYGPWAVVVGASEGLGAAFAERLATRGLSLVLLARRLDLLEDVAAGLRARHEVEVRTVATDAGSASFASALAAAVDGLEVGLLVYNAARAPIGPFLETGLDDLLAVVDVNVAGPVRAVRTLAPQLVARGRGGVVLMSSLAGLQGSPRIATYAASKAFNTILAEGLWRELAPHGVAVLVSCAGAIRTPGYQRATGREAPGTLAAADVAERTLLALGAGPRVVPGLVNRLAAFLMGRLLPRRLAIAMMEANTRELT